MHGAGHEYGWPAPWTPRVDWWPAAHPSASAVRPTEKGVVTVSVSVDAVPSNQAKHASRRALLAGALGGVGAWAAAAVGRASPVRAEGEPIVVGGVYTTATSVTRLRNQVNDETVFSARSDGEGDGVDGRSGSGFGVSGTSTSGYGVFGGSGRGRGVFGASNSGIGVQAVSPDGLALLTDGAVQFQLISGVATVPAGATGVTVRMNVNVTSSSFVLLTPKANIGSRSLWFTTQPADNRFRIHLSQSRAANTKVAWLMLS